MMVITKIGISLLTVLIAMVPCDQCVADFHSRQDACALCFYSSIDLADDPALYLERGRQDNRLYGYVTNKFHVDRTGHLPCLHPFQP